MTNPTDLPAGTPTAQHTRTGLSLGFASLFGWFFLAWIALESLRGITPGTPYLRVPFTGVSLTFVQIVYVCWFLFLDGPHLWTTHHYLLENRARLKAKAGAYAYSFFAILALPATIFIPLGFQSSASADAFPIWLKDSTILVVTAVLYWIWSYVHVTRQHWGVLRFLHGAGGVNSYGSALDRASYYLACYVPLLGLLLLGNHALMLRGTDLPFSSGIGSQWHGTVTALGAAAAVASVVLCIVRVLVFPGAKESGRARWSTVALLGLLSPLHALALLHPILVVFAMPLVTAGHNIQYQFWVKRVRELSSGPQGDAPRGAPFRRVLGFGVLLAIFLLAMPTLAPAFESLLLWAGVSTTPHLQHSAILLPKDSASFTQIALSSRLLESLLLGVTAQHYFLDGKLWRMGRDAPLRNLLARWRDPT